MSHVSTMAMTTTCPVMVVSSGLSSVSSVTVAPSLIVLPATLGQCEVVSATTTDAKRIWRCYWPCLCATAATFIFEVSSDFCQLSYRFSTGSFLFQS